MNLLLFTRVVVDFGRQMLTKTNIRSLKARAQVDNMVYLMYENYFHMVCCK